MSEGLPADWQEQLAELDARPVAEHPGVLDGLHRALVAELDALATGGEDSGARA